MSRVLKVEVLCVLIMQLRKIVIIIVKNIVTANVMGQNRQYKIQYTNKKLVYCYT